MTDFKRYYLLSAAALAFVPMHAAAQSGDYYSRDKYEAVTERYQPAFDPEPIRLGSFLVDSGAEAGITSTSNATGAISNEESDTVLRYGADARGRTDWNNHQLGFQLSAYRYDYQDFSDESYNDLLARGNGRLDVSRNWSVGGAVFVNQTAEPRFEPSNSAGLVGPIEYQQVGAEVFATYVNDRVGWVTRAYVTGNDYDDAEQFDGSIADQDYRDRTTYRGTSRLSYALSPNLAVFGQGEVTERNYYHPTITDGVANSRDTSGYTLSGGVDFELDVLVRGEVAVGYMEENKDSDAFEDVSGLSLDGRLFWFPSRLTTVSLDAGRSVVDSGVLLAPSAVHTNYGARVDHELRRNIILSAYGNYDDYDYEELNRTDEVTTFGLEGTYKMNRRVHFTAFARTSARDTTGIFANENGNVGIDEFGISIRVHP